MSSEIISPFNTCKGDIFSINISCFLQFVYNLVYRIVHRQQRQCNTECKGVIVISDANNFLFKIQSIFFLFILKRRFGHLLESDYTIAAGRTKRSIQRFGSFVKTAVFEEHNIFIIFFCSNIIDRWSCYFRCAYLNISDECIYRLIIRHIFAWCSLYFTGFCYLIYIPSGIFISQSNVVK